MKTLRWTFHYLGSIHFAVTLIAATATFVAAGTFLEAASDSHQFAARFTYSHPLFALLLWGFFVNILLSALRRWPFRWKHIPFLTTHVGLLMILSGTLYKSYSGVQGTMAVTEGTTSQQIFLAGTQVVHVESRAETQEYPLRKHLWRGFHPQLSDDKLRIRLLEYHPHCVEDFRLWIKGDHAEIIGLPPIQVQSWQAGRPVTPSARAPLSADNSTTYDIYAFKADDLEELVTSIYRQQATLVCQDAISGLVISESRLSEDPVIRLSPMGDLTSASFQSLDLMGPLPQQRSVDKTLSTLKMPASLLLVELPTSDQHLVLIGPQGQIDSRSFHPGALPSLYVLDRGYGGYTAAAEFETAQADPWEFFERQIAAVKQQMRDDITEQAELSPPLTILSEACASANVDFVDTLMTLIRALDHRGSWILPANTELPNDLALHWPTDLLQACQWTLYLLPDLEAEIAEGSDPLALLRQRQWPLLTDLEGKESTELLTLFTQQVFMLAPQLPPPPIHRGTDAQLLSACLRAYNLSLSELLSIVNIEVPTQTLLLETAVKLAHHPESPARKMEDNQASITLLVSDQNAEEVITLGFDRYGNGLKWPVLDGRYLLRFQPEFKQLPHRIRLREARQVNYPGSPQAFSYESDVLVTEADQAPVEATLSMNRVYESSDGYRFYMANLYPPEEGRVKQAQIVVNLDPMKYRLTYPGAGIMALGILLLFGMRPYRRVQ